MASGMCHQGPEPENATLPTKIAFQSHPESVHTSLCPSHVSHDFQAAALTSMQQPLVEGLLRGQGSLCTDLPGGTLAFQGDRIGRTAT